MPEIKLRVTKLKITKITLKSESEKCNVDNFRQYFILF